MFLLDILFHRMSDIDSITMSAPFSRALVGWFDQKLTWAVAGSPRYMECSRAIRQAAPAIAPEPEGSY